MPDDNESKDSKSDEEEEKRIIEILKGGFTTEHVLQQRVLAPQDDTEPNAEGGN